MWKQAPRVFFQWLQVFNGNFCCSIRMEIMFFWLKCYNFSEFRITKSYCNFGKLVLSFNSLWNIKIEQRIRMNPNENLIFNLKSFSNNFWMKTNSESQFLLPHSPFERKLALDYSNLDYLDYYIWVIFQHLPSPSCEIFGFFEVLSAGIVMQIWSHPDPTKFILNSPFLLEGAPRFAGIQNSLISNWIQFFVRFVDFRLCLWISGGT